MRNQPKYRFGIRFKLLLLSAVLLIVPWLGYRYILEMEEYLRLGQEQVVLGTAQALATALSERPELFSEGSYSRGEGADNISADLYVYPIYSELSIDDGLLTDWGDYQLYERSYREDSISNRPAVGDMLPVQSFRTAEDEGDLLNFRLMLGEYNRSLYAYLKVQDQNLVWRNPDGLRIDRSDSLRIAIETPDGVLERYIIAPYQDEFIYPYRIGTDITDVSSFQHEPRITGRWNQVQGGYEVEFRIPLDLLGDKMGLAVVDVDDEQTRSIAAIVGTSGTSSTSQLGTLRRPTPEIDRIVAGMGHTNSRIQVIDSEQRLLLTVGNLQSATGLVLQETNDAVSGSGPWFWVRSQILQPIYDLVLSRPTEEFIDELYEGGVIEGAEIRTALEGQPSTRFRAIIDDQGDEQTRILEAAYPIVAGGDILGAVLVDQNMNGIRTFRNQALEALFNSMLGILLLTMTALFMFASSLSSRIRQLRNHADRIIDDSGRLTSTFVASRSSDEIGDLSRSFSYMVERLSQYTSYLETMSSRLSHELRTPVTVVRSSLENLHMTTTEEEAKVYLERAEEGLKRLSLILANMSEASRLEQILLESDREKTDLGEITAACMAGYSQVYPGQAFDLRIADDDLRIMGGADYIAQLLDKLIANAIEFSYPDTAIRVSCYREGGDAVMSVSNLGPYLVDSMKDRIFDSMVSIRPEGRQSQPHLGMGLHIARMIADYHDGEIFADNLIREEGVIVTLRVPAMVRTPGSH